MRCINVSFFNFKGINDIDPSKTKEKSKDVSLCGCDRQKLGRSFFNDRNQLLRQDIWYMERGNTYFQPHYRELYTYFDNGLSKTYKVMEMYPDWKEKCTLIERIFSDNGKLLKDYVTEGAKRLLNNGEFHF